MSSLAAAIQRHSSKPKGCSVGRLIATLPKADATGLTGCLADTSVSSPAIIKGLEDTGHGKFSSSTVRRHRRHECECPQ